MTHCKEYADISVSTLIALGKLLGTTTLNNSSVVFIEYQTTIYHVVNGVVKCTYKDRAEMEFKTVFKANKPLNAYGGSKYYQRA